MKVHFIYLAAGNSRRFGSNKLLYEFHGQPLYQYGLQQLLELLSTHDNYTLDVVTQYDEIKMYVESISPFFTHLYCHQCSQSHLGISYSIQAGIKHYIHEEDTYYLFLVADQPYIQASTLQTMIEQVIEQKPLVVSLRYHHQIGNPTMFHSSLSDELMSLQKDEGGRQIIRKYQSQCLYISAKYKEELIDFDTLQDIYKSDIEFYI